MNVSRRRLRSRPGRPATLLPVVIAGLIGLQTGCGSTPTTAPPPPEARPAPHRFVPDHRRYLEPGEVTRYQVRWKILTVGHLEFELHPGGPEADMLAVRSSARPTAFARALTTYGGVGRSHIDLGTMLPRRYAWFNGQEKEPKRRYNDFRPGRARGLDIEGGEWAHDLMSAPFAHDPTSSLILLRVLELDVGETMVSELIEGTKRRRLTVRGLGETTLDVEDQQVPATSFAFRVDKLDDDGQPIGDPETDVHTWISADERRVTLLTEGIVSGQQLSIRLIERFPPPTADSEAL